MIERMRRSVVRALRVPPPPEPPAGSAASTRVFRAAPGFFYRRLIEWGLAQAGALAGLAFGLGFTFGDFMPEALEELAASHRAWDYIRSFELASIGLFALQMLISLIVVRLDYEQRWYIVTDRSLRLREGLFRVREQTVSFANIQNVSVKQGPLQRLLGIADLEIRTAGGGDASGDSKDGDHLHRAVFRGIDNAPEVRDRIREDLRRLKRLAEEPSAAESRAPEVSLAAASRRLADAAASLRKSLSTR